MERNFLCAQLKVNDISLFRSPMVINMLLYTAVCKSINKSVYLYT